MNINFAPMDANFIKNIVEDGYYSNATEAVRDAVRQMRKAFQNEENNRHARLMAALEEGEASLREHGTITYTSELMQQIFEEGLQDAANGVIPDPDVCP